MYLLHLHLLAKVHSSICWPPLQHLCWLVVYFGNSLYFHLKKTHLYIGLTSPARLCWLIRISDGMNLVDYLMEKGKVLKLLLYGQDFGGMVIQSLFSFIPQKLNQSLVSWTVSGLIFLHHLDIKVSAISYINLFEFMVSIHWWKLHSIWIRRFQVEKS